MALDIGKIIDERYRVVSRVGHGGMAEVYEAVDIINKNTVAIKIIKCDMMENEINLKRFQNETTIAANLNHPNIIRVLNQGYIDGRPYIAQEFISGQTLKNILDFRGSLPLDEAIDYMLQLLSALKYAHAHNVVHRDIKPENIFVLSDGSIKLGDFGIAIAESLDIKQTENSDKIVGSVYYLAPEIATGGLASEQSDIYSCGVTLFELITGHVPFDGDNPIDIVLSHVRNKFPSPRKYLLNCPKEIERIIFKSTMKKPSDRYHNVVEFYDELEQSKKNNYSVDGKKGFLSKLFGFK